MVNRRASEAAAPLTPIAPIAKRKRRVSCLGEQERRERKRAIDREAQRSLREKTKTHIAELERTIQILQDQDRNGATASLLSEIDVLRAENERLQEVIDNVRDVIGGNLLSRNSTSSAVATNGGEQENSPPNSVVQDSPKPRTVSFTTDANPPLPTPMDLPNPFEFQECIPKTSRSLDLDGMTVLLGLDCPSMALEPTTGLDLDLEAVAGSPETEEVEDSWSNDPATATWAPMMAEIFGPNWRCPSPVVLHIGNLDPSTPSTTSTICPVWKKSNELFGKVFHYRQPAADTASSLLTSFTTGTEHAEAGLLYLGIKNGWNKNFNDWMQSPALVILQQVDQLLFKNLPRMERLAAAYKSFKLLKYYLNATQEELNKVPEWLRPSLIQSSTIHPVAIDFFAWPTLRDRLVRNHASIFQTSGLSRCYSRYLRFDWPFTFEDAFFFDERKRMHVPSPLFERCHRDLKYWVVDARFYEEFPEMRGDIEGDRRRFSEVEVS